MAVNRKVVRFFMRTHQHANLNFVIFVCSQERSERVAGFYTLRQRRIESRLHVEERIRAGDIRFVDLRQVACGAASLCVGVWITNAQSHRLIPIVHAHGPGIVCRNSFGTWWCKALRTFRWEYRAVRIGNRIPSTVDTSVGLVSQLEIRKLEHELAVG